MNSDWTKKRKSHCPFKHTWETVNLYSDSVLERNKLTCSGGSIDVCKQLPRALISWIKCEFIYLFCVLLRIGECHNMLRLKFKIVITLVLKENSVDLSRYRFWRPKNHALKNKYRGKGCSCCAFHDFLVR